MLDILFKADNRKIIRNTEEKKQWTTTQHVQC